MYPPFYTKVTIVMRSGIIRRSYYNKSRYNNNQKFGKPILIYTGMREFRAIPQSVNLISLNYHPAKITHLHVRNFYQSSSCYGQEPSSKIEETVKNIKEQQEQKEKMTVAPSSDIVSTSEKALAVKKTLWQKVKAEMLHYYHGFRLLGLDMKISAKLIWRILHGNELSRREHRLLIKTTGDMFRLIPFSVFVVVPFMELLLPVAIKLFPGMLPSTFQTATDKEDKLKQALKVKIEMAKFLQKTLDEMAVQSSDHRSERAKEFAHFFYKVRTTNAVATNEEIMKFSKLFEDEITLDSLSRQQLIALCRVLDVQTFGTTNFLRFLLRMKLRSLSADDKLIEKEGIDSLTRAELQQACRARGMRAYGMPENKLKEQLSQWLDLSLVKKVPPSLLLLSRALMVSESIPTSDKLKATISALPDTVVALTKGAIGEKEGKVDHRTNIEIIKLEERKIEEEREEKKEHERIEKKEQEKKEQEKNEQEMKEQEEKEMKSEPSILTKHKEDEITMTDVQILEQALDNIGKDTMKMSVEKEELKELKEEMAEYQEDIQELYKIKAEAKGEADIESIKVSKGAKRLFKKVNKMIGKMDAVLSELEQSEEKIKKKLETLTPEEKKPDSKAIAELVKIDELIAAIKQIQSVPDESRLTRIAEILSKIDDDRDGSIKIEDVLKVVELIGKEDINLSKKQLDELIELMNKEEVLEVEEQIQKALNKEIKKIKAAQEDQKVKQSSPVPATPVTTEPKFANEELKEEVGEPSKNFDSHPSSVEDDKSSSSTVLKPKKTSDTVQSPSVASNVPPTPKKAEGSKQL